MKRPPGVFPHVPSPYGYRAVFDGQVVLVRFDPVKPRELPVVHGVCRDCSKRTILHRELRTCGKCTAVVGA